MTNSNPPRKLTKCTSNNNSSSNNNNKYGIDRNWSSLPADILRIISSRLTIGDYVTFTNVCTTWRTSRGPILPQMPFVLLPEPDLSNTCTLLDLQDNVAFHLRLPPFKGRSCVGSQDGWLILQDRKAGAFTLYNPFAQKDLNLPSYTSGMVRFFCGDVFERSHQFRVILESCFKKVVVSCVPDPAVGSYNPAAVVTFLKSGNLMYKLARERSWTIKEITCGFQDVMWWRGHFVGVQDDGRVFRIVLKGADCWFEPMGHALVPVRSLNYLVELEGSLLVVTREFVGQTHKTGTVSVRKLDPDRLEWVPFKDLGGYSVFLGASRSFCLESRQFMGLRDNAIYFTGDWCWMEDFRVKGMMWRGDLGVFDMRTRSYSSFSRPDIVLPTGVSSMWFLPQPELNADVFNDMARRD